MELILCACLVGVALAFAAGVLSFQNPVRATLALALAGGATAGALGWIGGSAIGGPAVWLSSTSAALLLFLTLLLNLSHEERGARRLSFRRTGALGIATFVFSALIGLALIEAPQQSGVVDAAALAGALFGPYAPLLVLALAALGLSVVAALLIARRQS